MVVSEWPFTARQQERSLQRDAHLRRRACRLARTSGPRRAARDAKVGQKVKLVGPQSPHNPGLCISLRGQVLEQASTTEVIHSFRPCFLNSERTVHLSSPEHLYRVYRSADGERQFVNVAFRFSSIGQWNTRTSACPPDRVNRSRWHVSPRIRPHFCGCTAAPKTCALWIGEFPAPRISRLLFLRDSRDVPAVHIADGSRSAASAVPVRSALPAVPRCDPAAADSDNYFGPSPAACRLRAPCSANRS